MPGFWGATCFLPIRQGFDPTRKTRPCESRSKGVLVVDGIDEDIEHRVHGNLTVESVENFVQKTIRGLS